MNYNHLIAVSMTERVLESLTWFKPATSTIPIRIRSRILSSEIAIDLPTVFYRILFYRIECPHIWGRSIRHVFYQINLRGFDNASDPDGQFSLYWLIHFQLQSIPKRYFSGWHDRIVPFLMVQWYYTLNHPAFHFPNSTHILLLDQPLFEPIMA